MRYVHLIKGQAYTTTRVQLKKKSGHGPQGVLHHLRKTARCEAMLTLTLTLNWLVKTVID
jgi:hypothetical protein